MCVFFQSVCECVCVCLSEWVLLCAAPLSRMYSCIHSCIFFLFGAMFLQVKKAVEDAIERED